MCCRVRPGERRGGSVSALDLRHGSAPNFGANVIVLNPTMPQSTIQSTLDAIATQQVPNQFGSQRYAILFEPGTYGSKATPLIFQVGYYTQVAGLGAKPSDVVVNGAIDVFNQCSGAGPCDGLNNFWRSLSNLTLNVTRPKTPPTYVPPTHEDPGCNNSNEMWAVSQAAPMRRVIMNGSVTLQDYCNRGFVSGGFLADDEFNGGVVINAGQQQFFSRNSNIDNWTNGVWNQVFLGDNGAPATSFGPGTNQYTTLPSTPVSQSQPFLYTDSEGKYNVFVPAVQHNSIGPSYAGGAEAGSSIPIRRFFIANPRTPVFEMNLALAFGQNLILTPGVYNLRGTIEVTRPDTVVLGLGFPTLIPQDGNVSMRTARVPGIKLSGIIFDAGPQNSRALLELGTCRSDLRSDRRRGHVRRNERREGCRRAQETREGSDPTLLQDIFFRIGGAEAGQATDSLIVNTDNTILDDVWAWRADHGAGAGWTSNRADTGVTVNGDHVTAYGLFVEHYQKFEVIWRGQNGEDVFFQNEMPYDPPSQSAWMSSPTTDGYAGSGGINSVINGVGGSSTAANADKPVDVASYP